MKLSWPRPGPDDRAALTAAAAATVIIALQLAGKATRDALFLSTFGIAALPPIVIIGAVLSGALAIMLARVMARSRPARLVPRLFVLSALLLFAEWLLTGQARRAAAILIYLHLTAVGAILVSGFWAIVNERFDPRTARRSIGQITAGGSIGGLLGGLLSERVGSAWPLTTMLPLLAFLQLLASALVMAIEQGAAHHSMAAHEDALEPVLPASQVLRNSSYLLALACLVALTSTAEGVLDYVFKARASAATERGEELLQFFAAFYTATALIGILIQVTALRPIMSRLGIARSASLLPAGVSLGAIGAFVFPGIVSVTVARATEVILRSSLFRGAYELLFTPVAQREKRATKLLLDVGAARVGDVAGGILILGALALPGGGAGRLLLVLTFILSVAALAVARRLHRGYVSALEGSLSRRAADLPEYEDAAALLQTVGGFDLSAIRGQLASSSGVRASADTVPQAAPPPAAVETDLRAAVHSGNADEVRRVLAQRPPGSDQVETVIELLAWDAVAADAIRALGAMPPEISQVLLRHLLDPDEDFAIRRRLVGVLGSYRTREAFEGLFQALRDRRFEVRYRAGLALSRMAEERPDLHPDRERVYEVVLREMAVERSVWESRQLIDAAADTSSPMETELLRDRVSRSLEHLFTLLSLVLPRSPLRLAFHALHTEDPYLRGTALEYLETILPEPVWARLVPLLEPGDLPVRRSGSSADAVRELLRSQETISVALSQLRKTPARRPPS